MPSLQKLTSRDQREVFAGGLVVGNTALDLRNANAAEREGREAWRFHVRLTLWLQPAWFDLLFKP